MKIAEINMTHYGSTGNIMFAIAEEAKKEGYRLVHIPPIVFQSITRGKHLM